MYNTKLHFHFIGIGGSGMSGIAEILLSHGYAVSGSDLSINAACRRLQAHGAEIFHGHRAENLSSSISLVVYSSAVAASNPEMQEAQRRGIPAIRRAEVLAELMRLKFGVGVAGSHGKTTTTSMIAAILEGAGLDPTVVIGGQVKSMGSGGKLGQGDFLVAETDESDRSFLLLKPTVAVFTNIDSEHLVAYESLLELEQSFERFVNSVPFYGLAILCIDDPKVRDLAARYKGRKLSYGLSPDASLRAVNIELQRDSSSFDVYSDQKLLMSVNVAMPGRHMVINALAAIAVGLEFDVSVKNITDALREFSGVQRRLETIGVGAGVTVINDYGHHPTEIRATIAAIREGWGSALNKLHVIFQPHRYSRTKDCFVDFLESFRECDTLTMTEIYAASEDPIKGISGAILFDAVVHRNKQFCAQLEEVPEKVIPLLEAGDVVLCLGAGSIGTIPERILEVLTPQQHRAVI